MNVLARGTLPPIDTLREQWRSTSLHSSWLYSDDWYHPEIDVLLTALTEGHSTVPACLRLGRARAAAGCGIAEAIDDLMCLFAALDRDTPAHLLRALSIGWTKGGIQEVAAMSCIEAESGLHTCEYFTIRLHEVYGSALDAGTTASRTHALLIADVGIDDLSFWQRVERAAGIGHLLRAAFPDGHPIASLGDGRYAILAPLSTDLDHMRRRLRNRIESGTHSLGIASSVRQPPHLWFARLPEDRTEATALLHSLRRPSTTRAAGT